MTRRDEPYKVGEAVGGKGIYFGQWAPKSKEGISLGKVFNLFAAPNDLANFGGEKALLTFNQASSRVANIKSLFGHDGCRLDRDDDIFKAIADGAYNGEWFIPTLAMLGGGVRPNHGEDRERNLFVRQNTGQLKDTFDGKQIWSHDYKNRARYWSSTRDYDGAVSVGVDFRFGGILSNCDLNGLLLSCRPVRCEEVLSEKISAPETTTKLPPPEFKFKLKKTKLQ